MSYSHFYLPSSSYASLVDLMHRATGVGLCWCESGAGWRACSGIQDGSRAALKGCGTRSQFHDRCLRVKSGNEASDLMLLGVSTPCLCPSELAADRMYPGIPRTWQALQRTTLQVFKRWASPGEPQLEYQSHRKCRAKCMGQGP